MTSPSLALRATGLLAEFNAAGVLSAADVHVAQRVGALTGESDPAVLLALALTVRSTRHGSVVLDLDTAAASTSIDADVDEPMQAVPVDLDWPEDWAARCRASPLLGGPLRMAGSRLWLERYWEQEALVADELLARSAEAPDDLDLALLRDGLARLFPLPQDADQREAAAVCALARVSVLAGGPGTGKTTTVSRLLVLLREQHPACRIALAAPTGKAAARLEEAVRSSAADLLPDDQELLPELSATTLHRLLGWRPEARTRFRHDRGNRLPYEVVVIDESSMLSLTLMARLLEALRPTTRLVLVGDPDQLASVEAGAVLGDLVAGPPAGGSPAAGSPATGRTTGGRTATGRTPQRAEALHAVLPTLTVPLAPETPGARVRDGVATLLVNRRFPEQSGIARLASAVQDGRGEDALAVLRMELPDVELIEVGDEAFVETSHLAAVRADVERAAAAMHGAALHADPRAALAALERHRLLCAHRRGARGVAHWSALVARWLAETQPVAPREDGHHLGEPLLVTTNDYEVGLYNGDTGVVVSDGAGHLTAAFGRGGAPVLIPLVRLGSVTRLHAMTVHRSQGSQFEVVTVVLPPAGSPLGTRQTLYTAVSRATKRVRLIGSVEAVLAAVAQPAARATGLADRLR